MAALFGVGFVDAVVPLPGGMDALVATAILLTGGKPFWIAVYITTVALGNAIGNIIIYGIGYKGGEVFLEKRLGKERFDALRTRFEKREIVTLLFAGLMPPPFPFKTVVLAAAVFEVNLAKFVLGIFLGRLFRFAILSTLVLRFGPQVLGAIRSLFSRHLALAAAVIAAALAAGVFLWRWKKSRGRRHRQTNGSVISHSES